MPDNSDHSYCLEGLKESQTADYDNRQKVREAFLFANHRSGQWEPYLWDSLDNRPRYTFDMVNPIIDQVAGEMEQADFDIKVRPSGGEATKDIAGTYDGLIRNIESISNAQETYNLAGRTMVMGGLAGWRVVHKYTDTDSFDQDLMIEPLNNYVDRVWLDAGSEKRDGSDSKRAWVMTSISNDEYKRRWPEGSEESVGEDRDGTAYYYKPDEINVGEYYYIKEEERELVLMSNGQVFEDDEDFKAVSDDLAAIGVTEKKRRKRKKDIVYIRKFDNGDWLEDERETVFSMIPVIPSYGNFSIFENKLIYWGVVEKLLDYQRVYNYAKSREIEEGALAPRPKYWMTEKQAAGHEDTLATMNTNADPVQFYNTDPEAAGVPQQNGGAAINQGLMAVSESMRQGISQAAGLFAANMGDNPGLQSGVAIEKLQRKGDTGTIKYFTAQEVAISQTAKILVDAIPKVYDAERQVRILNEDGSFDMTVLNQSVMDQQTGKMVQLNDLSVGNYDVTCSAGAAFQNRQQETVSAIIETAQVDPSIIQLGGDILLNNITAPGMDKLAERKRAQLLEGGAIPQEQWTDEEAQKIAQAQAQAAQQPQQPDPMMVAAQAELIKAKNEETKTQISVQEKSANIQLNGRTQDLAEAQARQSAEVDREKLQQAQEKTDYSWMMEQQRLQMDQQKQVLAGIKTQAETLEAIFRAMGVDAAVGPNVVEAYSQQAEQITESQENIET